MEARIRLRQGDVEVECAGDEAFVIDQLPKLVEELVRRLHGQAAAPVVQETTAPSSGGPVLVNIAGEVRDYWSNKPVAGAQVMTSGLAPELQGQADGAGRYVMSGGSEGLTYSILVTAQNYLDTMTGSRDLKGGVTSLNARAVSQADLQRQYALSGLTQATGMATVMVELIDAREQALESVSSSDLSLSAGGNIVSDGPFFFGPAGDVDPSLALSQAFGARARAAFLNVPIGRSTISLTGRGQAGSWQRVEMPLIALADTVTVLEARLLR